MFTLCKTVFGACWRYCCVNHFCVTKCWNDILFYKSFATNGTMFTFGKTSIFTIWSHCIVHYFGVTERLNYLLGCDNFATYGAMCALCEACFCTCWRFCIVNHFGVTKCWNNILFYNDFATSFTMLTFGETYACASWINCFVYHYIVAKCIYVVRYVSVATVTCVGCVTLVFACWSSYNCVVAVTCFWNYCLGYKYFATNFAVFTFCQTSCCACCGNCFVNNFAVTEFIHYFLLNKNFVAYGAMFTFG